MKPLLPSLVLVALALTPLGQAATEPPDPLPAAGTVAEAQRPRAKRPRIEVVFALDTTGSMGGLIEGAKAKVWSIARALAAGKPTPEIAIGLVAYRDLGDEYTTRVTPLSSDLDAVYRDLMALRADGGGDGPEHVNRAIAVATHDIAWSEARGTTRILFLVGDAPPHMDYAQDVPWMTSIEKAVRKGIVVNTVRCGSDPTTEEVWGQIARRGEGRYVSLAQDGGMAIAATPHDEELAALRRRLESTYLTYGVRAEREGRMAAAHAMSALPAAPAAAADRAAYLAETKSEIGEKDLVSGVAAGAVDVSRLDAEALPEELALLPARERTERVAELARERADLERQIARLSARRDEHLAKTTAASGARDAFDTKVLEAVREQAGKNGVRY